MNFANENQLETYFKTLERPMSSMVWYQLNSSGYAKSGTGVILERQIPGFLTNKTTGRDALSADITELTYSHRDGATYRSKRNLSRDITIEYTLTSVDEKTHRKKLNKLRSILMGGEHEQAIFRFRDEPDVFYIGSVKSITEAKFVRSFASNGQIQIHCSDPFKYSWELKKATAVMEDGKLQFKINYKGSYPSSPKFVVTHSAKQENGYIAFTDERSHIIQIGDPSEKDGYSHKATAQNLVFYDFECAGKMSDDGWHFNIFTAPTANTKSAHPIYCDGSFYKYFYEFARTANSKLPDGSGLWLKTPGEYNNGTTKCSTSIIDVKPSTLNSKDCWHGPSMFHGFYDATGKALHATNNPVKNLHLDMKYVFAKQTNGKEDMQAGYEIILFGIDKDNPKGAGETYYTYKCSNSKFTAKNGQKKTIKSANYLDPTYSNGRYFHAYPLIRIAIWNTSPNNTKAKAWIQINQKHKQTIEFDCKMPLELKTVPKKPEGWVNVTGGKRYYKKGKFLKGWQKIKDTKGTYWYYFDPNGYALNEWQLLDWSKAKQDTFYFKDYKMVTGSIKIDDYTYTFDKNGVLSSSLDPSRQPKGKQKAGWHGNGRMWRYWVKKGNKYVYLTGWQYLKDAKGKFWFYFGTGGYMYYGWKKLRYIPEAVTSISKSSKGTGPRVETFYFDTNGHMVTGTKKINGKTYTFSKDGVLTSGATTAMTQSARDDDYILSPDAGEIRFSGETDPTDVYQKMTLSTLTIEKYQKKVSVTINGKTYAFTGDIPDSCIFTGVGIQEYVLGAHGKFTYTQDRINKGTPIGVQYIDTISVKQLTTKYKDVKNSLDKSSKVVVNCSTGDIYYNGKKKPELGALGNDYDTLLLMPSYTGEKSQRIQCLYSKWVTNANKPTFEIQYREVFL